MWETGQLEQVSTAFQEFKNNSACQTKYILKVTCFVIHDLSFWGSEIYKIMKL